MRQAVNLNRLCPFKVGSGDLPVSHLQYADDTVFIGEAKVENLWVMKAILR
ncbi:LINE-1 reverse transcriptase like, partial [Trifolium medium]|nr:LINE-1 reverse transcriptase like [Trifolium medium]